MKPVLLVNHYLVDKKEGSYAGTILENGTIQIKAEKVGEDTTFGKIIELVEEAQDSKSEAERFIDRFFEMVHANRTINRYSGRFNYKKY